VTGVQTCALPISPNPCAMQTRDCFFYNPHLPATDTYSIFHKNSQAMHQNQCSCKTSHLPLQSILALYPLTPHQCRDPARSPRGSNPAPNGWATSAPEYNPALPSHYIF